MIGPDHSGLSLYCSSNLVNTREWFGTYEAHRILLVGFRAGAGGGGNENPSKDKFLVRRC